MTRWEEWAQENVDREALYRNVPRRPAKKPAKEPRQCECGARFTPANASQVWCSARCRSRGAMSEKRARDERSGQEMR